MSELRFFSGLHPFMLLSKETEKYPQAVEIYNPDGKSGKGRRRWVFKALMNDPKKRWAVNEIILLPPRLMFKSLGSRYYKIKPSKDTKEVMDFVKNYLDVNNRGRR